MFNQKSGQKKTLDNINANERFEIALREAYERIKKLSMEENESTI
jgi:hypothetical protein